MKPRVPILVGVAGPSGAGKSTFCKRAEQEHNEVMRFKFDDFYVSASEVETHPSGYQYWDHPSSIKWDELIGALRRLKAGQPAEIPNYSKAQDKMVGTKLVQPSPVILVDGIQVLWDERLRALLDRSIYFDLHELAQVDRRILRQPDVNREYLWRVMLPANRAYLEPTKLYATHVVDALRTPEAVYQEAAGYLRTVFDTLYA